MRTVRKDPYYEGYVELLRSDGLAWDAYLSDFGRLVLEDDYPVAPPTAVELCEMWRLWREVNPDTTPSG